MGLISAIKDLVSPKGGLYCPRCEKPLDGHDEKACERRMSRRYFFGAALGGVAAAVALPAIATEAPLPYLGPGINTLIIRQVMKREDAAARWPLSRLDILYGFSVMRPEFAFRIIDDGTEE